MCEKYIVIHIHFFKINCSIISRENWVDIFIQIYGYISVFFFFQLQSRIIFKDLSSNPSIEQHDCEIQRKQQCQVSAVRKKTTMPKICPLCF